MLAENRMIVRNVRTDQKNNIGFAEIFIRSRWTVAAERTLVARDRAGHTKRGIAVVVFGSEAKLHELAQRVKLFRDKLARAHYTQRILAIFFLCCPKLCEHRIEGF